MAILTLDDVSINKPTHVIPIAHLLTPSFHSVLAGTKSYCYALLWNWIFMKIGQSDEHERIFGERLYRQVAYLPGWHQYGNDVVEMTDHGWVPRGGNGPELLVLINQFNARYKTKMHKDSCVALVWDLTNVPNDSIYKNLISRKAEDILVEQHRDVYHAVPLGNFKDTKVNTAYTPVELGVSLFGANFKPDKKKRL